jgi:pimeloyl-ACP methyl ester carboxylesterase
VYAALLLSLSIACGPDGPAWRPGGTKDTGNVYVPPGGGGDEVELSWVEDPEATWACADDPEGCIDTYLGLPEAWSEHADPISESTLEAQLDAMADGEVEILGPDEVSDDALDSIVSRELNMGFLLEGLDERALTVTEIHREQRGGYRELHLILDDPWVGAFFALLLIPDGAEDDPVPGVLSVHGHGQQAGDVLDDLFGREYPDHGYALMTFTFRGMGADASEDEATRALLLEGFTLEAVRIYESLLALKVLRWLEEVDAERLAVVGHSGGSLAWNLAVRGHPPVKALVSDLQGTYYDVWKGSVLDDTIPGLHPYHPAINELSGTGVAIRTVDYSYQEEFDEIVSFLDEWIGGS